MNPSLSRPAGALVEGQGPDLAGLPPIRSAFQPIVDLLDGGVVACEALVRGRFGAELTTPDQLFGWAHASGRLADLDWACRMEALTSALELPVPAGSAIFVNVEPAALAAAPPAGFEDLVRRVDEAGIRVVVELTERSLAADPAALLAAAAGIRARGWALAIDDVGADPSSLAMMPFVEPEVIKLDLRLIQEATTTDIARIVNAVNAQAARSGALILAEGVETLAQQELALSMGAHLGQGWLYGHPVPPSVTACTKPLPLRAVTDQIVQDVPWDLVHDHASVRRARKPLLAAMSRHLERQALTGDSAATFVLGTFQQARYFTPSTARRYEQLAQAAFLVAALAQDLPSLPAAGVLGQSLDPRDRMLEEWTIVVVSSHFAAALIAHDVGVDLPESERQFDYVLSYDRDVVLSAARCLMRRLRPHGPAIPRQR